jgi:phosphoribosylglycinamide formyltransferase-1
MFNNSKTNIAIFASGEGSNAQNIIENFKDSDKIKVALVVSNKKDANVLKKADSADIPTLVINREDFYSTDNTIEYLKQIGIEWVILAGFLWMVPDNLIKQYPNHIINIHPSLLPKFGGKGMYGMNVHKAVIEAKEQESGITIHHVNEKYDDGEIIAQYKCVINKGDTPETLSEKIRALEHQYYPKVIEGII